MTDDQIIALLLAIAKVQSNNSPKEWADSILAEYKALQPATVA